MKKKTKPAKAAKRFPRPPVLIVTAIVVVAIAAVTVVSRQSAHGSAASGPQKVTTVTSAAAAPTKYTKVKVAGQDVQVDQNGQIKPLTPEEAKRLADSLKGLLNKSTEGLVEEHHEDGSKSIDLQGRFQHVAVARTNQDGTVSQSCVDNPKAAANFFGIDQKLLEPAQPTNPNQ